MNFTFQRGKESPPLVAYANSYGLVSLPYTSGTYSVQVRMEIPFNQNYPGDYYPLLRYDVTVPECGEGKSTLPAIIIITFLILTQHAEYGPGGAQLINNFCNNSMQLNVTGISRDHTSSEFSYVLYNSTGGTVVSATLGYGTGIISIPYPPGDYVLANKHSNGVSYLQYKVQIPDCGTCKYFLLFLISSYIT